MGTRRIARALWIAWALILWNVVFDRVIVVAGRAYILAAEAVHGSAPYARMDDWMRPAAARAFWMATSAAAIILIVGFTALRRASTPASAKRNP